MENYLKKTFWITFIVLIILFLLHFFPAIHIGSYTVKRVDLLSDIRKSDTISEKVVLPPLKKRIKDSSRSGMTDIKDFSDCSQRGMAKFYQALDEIKSKHRTVRIAVLGDSFIEADILTADLREMLQNKYGGCGVGFVSINSMTGAYRPTIHQKSSGFIGHSALKKGFDKSKEGLSGCYFIPSNGAFVELRGQNDYAAHLDTCDISYLYFINKTNDAKISVNVNGRGEQEYTAGPSPELQKLCTNGKIGSIRWSVKKASSSSFYGIAMDGKQGIVVDNFSLRGNSGFNLRNISESMLRGFDKQRHYDLIILEYGLNVLTSHVKNYDWYERGFVKSIEHLKKCFPNTGFLMLGVSDRDYRAEDGDFKTMPEVKILLRYQENIAAETNIAFWNMFEAMGGDESMSRMVRAKPALANYDYTHINFRGGKHLAKLLYDSLIFGKQEYDRRRVNENK